MIVKIPGAEGDEFAVGGEYPHQQIWEADGHKCEHRRDYHRKIERDTEYPFDGALVAFSEVLGGEYRRSGCDTEDKQRVDEHYLSGERDGSH